MGRDPAPGPCPPRFRVGCQLYMPYLSPTLGHPHGATRQTHAPLHTNYHFAERGSTSNYACQNSHLGEPPGGDGPLSAEFAARATGAGKTMNAQAQPPGGLESGPHYGVPIATLRASSRQPDLGQLPLLQLPPLQTSRQYPHNTITWERSSVRVAPLLYHPIVLTTAR